MGYVCVYVEEVGGERVRMCRGASIPPPPRTWDITGYGGQAGSTRLTGMLSCQKYMYFVTLVCLRVTFFIPLFSVLFLCQS